MRNTNQIHKQVKIGEWEDADVPHQRQVSQVFEEHEDEFVLITAETA